VGKAVGEHGRAPQFGATFGARALEYVLEHSGDAPTMPVIPSKLALLDTPRPA